MTSPATFKYFAISFIVMLIYAEIDVSDDFHNRNLFSQPIRARMITVCAHTCIYMQAADWLR